MDPEYIGTTPSLSSPLLNGGDGDEEQQDNTDISQNYSELVPVSPWWKQKHVLVINSVALVIILVVAIVLGVTLSSSNNNKSSSSSNNYSCFDAYDGGLSGALYFAVRAYVDQDCANNTKCGIGQTYGWPMNSWCVGFVTDMSWLFTKMDTFNEDINGWNTSSVTDMSWMFEEATSFNGDLSNFDTSSVTNMAYMFQGASSFNRDLLWNTSSVTNMNGMFSGVQVSSTVMCQTLIPQELFQWAVCSLVPVYSMEMYQTLTPQGLLQ